MSESEPAADDQSQGQNNQPTGSTDDDSATAATVESTDEASASGPFSATIEAGTLQDALDAVAVLFDECKINLTPGGWEIRAVDAANVAMVDLELDAAAFESYDGTGGTLGVPLDRFRDAVGMADTGHLVQLAIDPETRKLNIHCEGLDFSMALIDPDTIRKEPDEESLNFDVPAMIKLEGRDLTRAKKAADMVADHVQFIVDSTDEQFRVKAEGDTDEVDLELDRDRLEALDAADASSIFSLDYIKDIVRPIGRDTTVTLHLGNNFPVIVEYELGEDAAEVRNLVAPRIESDD
jgi:proliferating cell nuclear antigen